MKKVLLMVLGVALVATGYFVTRARAGVPSTTPLFYSGFLEDQNGPVNGTKSIVLRIYDDANAGSQVCNPSPSGTTAVAAGRFRFALDPGCVTAIHSNAELWLQLEVDGQTIPRTKIGAVPYALEAGGIDWANVKGVPAEWPGTVPWARVTNPSPKPIYANGTKLYSLSATYCGKTSTSYDGAAVGGYAAAKSKCESTCGNSPTAHVCSSEELLRVASTGGSIDEGWYNTGFYGDFYSGMGARNDCDGWTSNSSTNRVGALWSGIPSAGICNTSHPILCCD